MSFKDAIAIAGVLAVVAGVLAPARAGAAYLGDNGVLSTSCRGIGVREISVPASRAAVV